MQENIVVDEDDDEELDLDHDPLVNLTDDVEVEDELEEDHQEQIEVEDEKTKEIPLVSDYFKSFKSYLKDNFDKKLEKWDIQKVGQVIDEFKQNAKNLMPDQTQIKQIKQSAEELGAVLKDKWDQLDFKEEKKKVDKLGKKCYDFTEFFKLISSINDVTQFLKIV